MSIKNISLEVGCSITPIDKLLKNNNIRIRKRGETFIGEKKNYKTVGFEKGLVPWNKGLKGVIPANKGSFKKGLVPWNKGMIFNPNRDFLKKIRSSEEYLKWRVGVYNRDNNTCQFCGHNKKENIVAHHIYRLKDIVDDYNITNLEEAYNCDILWNINIGISLCVECHKKVHYGGGVV